MVSELRTRRLRQLLTGGALLLASACAAGSRSEAVPLDAQLAQLTGASTQERLRQYAEHALAVEDATRAVLRARYGAPDSSTARAVANRHIPNQTDSIVTVHYPGLAVELYWTAGGRELVQRVDVQANRWLRHAPGIGAAAATVVETLGTPVEQTDSTVAFLCTTCGPVEEPITFFLADGRVRRVRFAFYVD